MAELTAQSFLPGFKIKRMNKIYKSLITVASIFIGIYAFSIYTFFELGIAVHPMMKANFKTHPIGIYFHIFPSLIALILGPFQFNEKFRNSKTYLHRLLGKVYLLCVLIGGLSVHSFPTRRSSDHRKSVV